MSRPAIIETPFPSLEETARILGVSAAQARRVESLMTFTERNGRRKTKKRASRAATTSHAAKKSSKRA